MGKDKAQSVDGIMDIIFKRKEWSKMKINGRTVTDELIGIRNRERRIEI